MQAESSPQPGQLVGGKYRMVRELGRGAMGAVYEAEQLATGKRVAIKWLHPHVLESRSAVERLVREAQASARVRHTNVVDVYDVEREGGTLFLVMEYLQGETLGALLERGGVPFHELIAVIVQAMRGVAEAHRQGIVHRDIKPDNIFLAVQSDRAEPIAKVLDFGISKLDQPGALSLTQTGSTLGTPLYMSYEQLSGSRDVDARSDIYAFGVILYESLTGTLPYSAENFAELAAKVITSDAPAPRQLRPDIPERLEQIVIWAMKRRREERPANLGMLIDALLPFTTAPRGRVSLSSRASVSSIPRAVTASMAAPAPVSASLGDRPTDLPPPVQAVPSSPAPPSPSLRLDAQHGDWGEVLDRTKRSRLQMEESVTALIAGTMPEYERQKPAARRGLWMGVGALTTLLGGIAIAGFLLGERPTPAALPRPVVVAPAQGPTSAPVPTRASTPAAVAPKPAPSAEQQAAARVPELLRAAAPTQVEPVQMDLSQPARAAPASEPEVSAAGKASPARPVSPARPGVVRGNTVWRPSGESDVFQPPAPSPSVDQSATTPVAQPPSPAPSVEQAKPAAPTAPATPATIEVPGTAPNPFVEGEGEPNKYRAGRPSEDEF